MRETHAGDALEKGYKFTNLLARLQNVTQVPVLHELDDT